MAKVFKVFNSSVCEEICLVFRFLFGWSSEKFKSGKNQKGRRTEPMRKTKKQKNKKEKKKKTHQGGRADFDFKGLNVFLGGF